MTCQHFFLKSALPNLGKERKNSMTKQGYWSTKTYITQFSGSRSNRQFWHLNSRNTRFLFHQNQGGSTLWEKTHPFLHRSKAVDVQWKKPSQKGGGFKHHFMPPTMGSLEATNPSLNGSHLMITVNITAHSFSKHWKELNTIFVRYQQQTLLGNGEASLDPKMFSLIATLPCPNFAGKDTLNARRLGQGQLKTMHLWATKPRSNRFYLKTCSMGFPFCRIHVRSVWTYDGWKTSLSFRDGNFSGVSC